MNIETILMPSNATPNVGDEFEVAVSVRATDGEFHCNAFDAVVEFDRNTLSVVAVAPEPAFPNSRLFNLLEFSPSFHWDSNIQDGDFGYTFWAGMYGSDVSRYPKVDSGGLLLGKIRFKAKAAGGGFVRLSSSLTRYFKTVAYDASAPNFKRPVNVLGVATVVMS